MTNDEMDARQASQILDILAQVDKELGGRLDFQRVLEITHRWALQGSLAERSWVILKGDENSADGNWLSFPDDVPELDHFAQSDSVLLDALSNAAPAFSAAQPGQSARLAVPILHGEIVLGVILVERSLAANQIAHDQSEALFLSHLASRSAAAIDNARLNQAVQRANQAKSKFVSVVTHELRIPMTSIKGYTDLMRTGIVGPVNDQQRSFLEVIRNNVERMSALVSDLSDISRAETGRLKLNCKWFSFPDVIDETIRNLQPKVDEKSQSLVLNLPPDLPKVFADSSRTTQIITNLLSNAIKYSPSEGKIQILVVLDDHLTQEGLVRVEVADEGIGIGPDDQEKIFSQFFRSEDPLVREEQGWGLGLCVAKLLTELMGGKMGFSSTLKQGSTFWFTLSTTEIDCDSRRVLRCKNESF